MKRSKGTTAASAELLAELAHDLRNFLEGLDQMVLSRPEIAADSDVRDIVHREILALILKTERHSDGLRANASPPSRPERVELLPLCESTTRSLSPFLRKREVSIDVPDGVSVSAERAGLARALAAACHAVCRSTRDMAPLRLISSRDGEDDVLALVIASDECLESADGSFRLEELEVYDRVLRREKGSLVYERDGARLRVTLSIPLDASEAESESESESESAGDTPTGSRVLVVDDNEDSARSLAVLLELEGCQTEVRLDGRSALEAARAQPPDVVLLDLGLPDVDGFKVCGELRDAESTKRARIVAVSGFGDEDSRRRMDDAGFDDHLLKPVNPDALRRVLDAARPS